MTTETRIDGSDACVFMHTALRKACDSKITSCVYNLVHLIDIKPKKFDPWCFLGKLVADRLNGGEKSVQALKAAHHELEDKFLDMIHVDQKMRDQVPENTIATMYALSCAMACFDKADWEGMAAYLGEE